MTAILALGEMKRKLRVVEESERRLRRERCWNLFAICRLKSRVKTLVEKAKEPTARGSLVPISRSVVCAFGPAGAPDGLSGDRPRVFSQGGRRGG